MKKQLELRYINVIDSSEEMVLRGTIPYEEESVWMGFTEILKRGCFKKTVQESHDLKFLEGHDHNKLRARGKNGSLIVTEDDIGVHFEAHLLDTQENRDLYAKVKGGLLSNVSFGFVPIKERNIGNLREIIEARLFEISAVGEPAYEQTTLSCRSLSQFLTGQEITEESIEQIKKEIEQLSNLLPKEEATEDNIEDSKEGEVPSEAEQTQTEEPVVEEPATPSEPTVLKSEYDSLLEEYNTAIEGFTAELNKLKEAI